MRSEVREKARRLVARIGERVFMVWPGKGSDAASSFLAGQSSRQLESEIAEGTLRYFQLPTAGAAAEIAIGFAAEDAVALLRQRMQDSVETAAFLATLFKVPAQVLRLHADPMFLRFTRDLLETEGLASARVHVDCIEGYNCGLATVPARAGFADDSLVIACDDQKVASGLCLMVSPFLASDSDGKRLVAMDFPHIQEGAKWLLLGTEGLVSLEPVIRKFSDLDSFRASDRASEDAIATLILADDEIGPILNRFVRQGETNPVMDEPLLGLRFVLQAAVSLDAGLFVCGWFDDPGACIDCVYAIDPSLQDSEISGNWHIRESRVEFGGHALAAKHFCAFLPREASADRTVSNVAVRILLEGGESHLVRAPAVSSEPSSQRRAILDSISGPSIAPGTFESVYHPALSALQDKLNAKQAIRTMRRFGAASSRRASLIIPLYRETRFVRSQLMAFAADPHLRGNCEIVYVLDDPLIADTVLAHLAGAEIAHGLDVNLVTLERNGGYALANNLGASVALGDVIVLMNSDVIPAKSGWLEPATLRLLEMPASSAVGPKLLYADDTLQHAGMYFHQTVDGDWQNRHFWKGFGRRFDRANRECTVPALTGGCMIVRKEDFLAVGGFSPDYIIGDFEDSDLCLRLRERGGECLYMPSIELYHFERQSMPGGAESPNHGSSIYNSALHRARWGAQLSASHAVSAPQEPLT